jgi:hypothetical protein
MSTIRANNAAGTRVSSEVYRGNGKWQERLIMANVLSCSLVSHQLLCRASRAYSITLAVYLILVYQAVYQAVYHSITPALLLISTSTMMNAV